MKLILCFGIFSAFVFIGRWIYHAFRARKQYFESLVRFCDNLVTEIGFSKKTVAQIIQTYIDGYSLQFAQDLLSYAGLLRRHEDLTHENLVLWTGLKTAERHIVTNFFLELGKHSVTEELEKIKKARGRFEAFRAESAEKLKRDASIYLKICILLGIGVVILIL